MAKYQKKYRKGPTIRLLSTLYEILFLRQDYVFLRDQPKHPSIIISMTLRTVVLFLEGGALSEAIPTQEVTNVNNSNPR